MSRRKAIELITDPSSGQLSMSRLALGILILDIIGLSIADLMGIKITIMGHLAVIVSSVCGVYGLNTGIRVWRGKVIQDKGPAKSGPPQGD